MEENAPESTNSPTTEEKTDQEKSVVEEPKTSPNESEYDSAGSYSEDEVKVRSRSSERISRSGSESEGSVGLERQSGDGQESLPSRKVDDDEDKKNPQYIPKRGTFYEHDDRTAEDGETPEPVGEVEKEKDGKNKKVWQDKKERWGHDKFNDSDQAPKSRAELVAIYGYDIRNEDGPPRARRRRRYGRGPNKYTRNWEDEDAYNKPPPPPRTAPASNKNKPPRRNQGEEFPPLSGGGGHNQNNSRRHSGGSDRDDNRYNERSTESQVESSGSVKSSSSSLQAPCQPAQDSHRFPEESSHEPHRSQGRVGSGRVLKQSNNKREIKESDYRGFTTKTRQVRNIRTEQQIVTKHHNQNRPKDDFIQSQNFTNRSNVQDLDKEMGKLSVQEGGYNRGKGGGGQRQGSVPPRLQNEQKGNKRYSSIRQRSLPESATPPYNQHSNYYPNTDYNQQGQVGQQGLIHQNAQIHPSSTQVPQIAAAPLQPIPQVPVTATPILQAPQFAPSFPPGPPAFLQPGVPPSPFIPQQTTQIINYVPSQPQFPQGFQGYQQQFNPVTQPAELYQPQTGITYYSTDHQVSQRAVPQKRPKAAIPIVAPPPLGLSKPNNRANKDEDGQEVEAADNSKEQCVVDESNNIQEAVQQ